MAERITNTKLDEMRWTALTVAERIKILDEREKDPRIKAMNDRFNASRARGFGRPKVDLVPCFVDAWKGQREESRIGTKENRGAARAAMRTIEGSARQQLSRADFARFKEGIK